MELQFAKGHGTGNDFVIIDDSAGEVELLPEHVRKLADRHTGVGGDGVIRAVPARLASDAAGQEAGWFMDYRNADGSVSEMCGNGVRVFARYLLEAGLARFEDGRLPIATRAGIRVVREHHAGFEVDMGQFAIGSTETLVRADGLDVARPGLPVDTGNPHVVVALATDAELASLELARSPGLEPAPEAGANVEFVVPGAVRGGIGEITMRVHERGVGETRSCGTGAVAAAVATRHWVGESAPDQWRVQVPGGELFVTVRGSSAALAGPAEIVFRSTITLA